MFHQTFIESKGRGVKAWALAASFLGQGCLVGLSILLPLVFTYDLPVADWVRQSLLLAPPPPPAMRAEPGVTAPAVRARFETMLPSPQTIPQNALRIDDGVELVLTTLAAPNIGATGGIDGDGSGSVLGVIGAINSAIRVPDKPIRVGGAVKKAEILHRVTPVYPAEALAKNVMGVVELDAIINRQGLIREVKVLSGDPLLTASAVKAVEQWRYRPTLLNGVPVEVIIRIEINFKFTEPPKKTEKKRK